MKIRPSNNHELLKEIWDMLSAREAAIRLDEAKWWNNTRDPFAMVERLNALETTAMEQVAAGSDK
jgi:hypothetical protein